MTVKQKIGLLFLIVIIGLALILYFVIIPTINDIRDISVSVFNERVDLEKKYLRGQLLRKTIEDFQRIKPDQDKFANVFVKEGNELDFITTIENIADRHNVKHNIQLSSNRTNEDTAGSYYSLPIQISVQGTFIDTMQYLSDLEKMGYYFSISDIAINTDKGPNGQPLLSTVTAGKIYVLPIQKNN